MKRETLVWTLLMVVGGLALLVNAISRNAGTQYEKVVEKSFVAVESEDGDVSWISVHSDRILDYDVDAIAADRRITWIVGEIATPADFMRAERDAQEAGTVQTEYRFSMSRTVGTWLAALFTLAIFSFLYRDNPFYKTTEAIIVGVSAAYWMVVGFWDTLIPILFANLFPDLIRASIQPGIDADASMAFKYLIPLVLGIMLLWRLAPVGGWISRWPMAFIIGAFCGLRLVAFIHADFLSQINGSIIPIWAMEVEPDEPPSFDFWESVKNIVLLLGILCCLVYFFFSIEHKGAVGQTARVGIFFLMITFGAAFGYTVMGRIALLAIRLEFLFDDWLWLIDPMQRRAMDLVAVLGVG